LCFDPQARSAFREQSGWVRQCSPFQELAIWNFTYRKYQEAITPFPFGVSPKANCLEKIGQTRLKQVERVPVFVRQQERHSFRMLRFVRVHRVNSFKDVPPRRPEQSTNDERQGFAHLTLGEDYDCVGLRATKKFPQFIVWLVFLLSRVVRAPWPHRAQLRSYII
jgi:hypothetical protein